MTANEKLQDLLLERSLILERIKGSVSNDLTKIYDELFKDISKRINESDLTIKESERLIKLLEKDLTIPYAELGNDLNALAQDESKFMLNAVNAAAGIDIATALPTNKTINKIANASLMEGATIKNWFGSLEQSLQFDVAREVRQSIIQGKTNKEVTDALKGILNTSSRNARTLALTGIATVTNQVRQQTVKENEDIFKGQKAVVTFDGKTSDICISYSNSSWDMEGNILTGNKAFREPPYHMRCRTILLPIIKSFRELGIDLDEMKGATKASMDGQIPKDMSFDEWLKTKPKSFVESTLGKGRAELFLDGKINLSQLTDLRGNPLTIKELTNIQTPKIIVPRVPKIDNSINTIKSENIDKAIFKLSRYSNAVSKNLKSYDVDFIDGTYAGLNEVLGSYKIKGKVSTIGVTNKAGAQYIPSDKWQPEDHFKLGNFMANYKKDTILSQTTIERWQERINKNIQVHTTANYAKSKFEYAKITMSHEAWHKVDMDNDLTDSFMKNLYSKGIIKDKLTDYSYKISYYAGKASDDELFAEVGALYSNNRKELIPKEMLEAFEETIKKAKK